MGAPRRGGSPPPSRSRNPTPWHAPPRAGLLPLILYILGQGAPLDTQVGPRDHILSRCAVPPSTIILDNIVAVLRRSPATVEHQDRHHAVMLTELLTLCWIGVRGSSSS